jgi:two-component system sensor histidine kinase KdpD
VYAVATAGEAGTSVHAVAGALLERLARATRAERALLALAPDGDDPGGVAAAWDSAAGLVAPPPVDAPHDPGSLAAAVSLPEAVVIPLTARDRPVGSVVLGGDVDRDTAARLAVPGALALDAVRRAELAAVRAERADRLSSLTRDLMSIVSHELRTPLTSVIGSLQTLQRTGVDPSGPEGRRLLASALDRAERLRTLIDDLLVTARAEVPVRTRHRPMDPAEVVRSAIGSVPGAAPLVAVDVDARVGPVLLDRGHLERVLVNLIDNAVRHGGGTVDLTVARSEQRLVITIADRGPGLPPTIARAVLDRRHDSPDTALRPSGPGLGLTVTRSLVEGLEGTLHYETTPGGGATFVVELPYRDGR